MFEGLLEVRSELPALLRLLLAAALGGIVGLERERRDKPAGFRTHLLICVGAALLTEISIRVAAAGSEGGFQSDPGRIAAQIVSGIGFLGAGTIVQARANVVMGLTTAASLWVVAAIGMAVGAGQLLLALATTVVVMIALWLLGRLESAVRWRGLSDRMLEIDLADPSLPLPQIRELLLDAGVDVRSSELQRTEDGYVAKFRTRATDRNRHGAMERLMKAEGVRRVAST